MRSADARMAAAERHFVLDIPDAYVYTLVALFFDVMPR